MCFYSSYFSTTTLPICFISWMVKLYNKGTYPITDKHHKLYLLLSTKHFRKACCSPGTPESPICDLNSPGLVAPKTSHKMCDVVSQGNRLDNQTKLIYIKVQVPLCDVFQSNKSWAYVWIGRSKGQDQENCFFIVCITRYGHSPLGRTSPLLRSPTCLSNPFYSMHCAHK